MSAKSMVTPGQVRERALASYRKHGFRWAAQTLLGEGIGPGFADGSPLLSVPLHPPTERQALENLKAARAWAQAWREVQPADDVAWEERRWPSVGRQRVPVRFTLQGPRDVAAFAGKGAEWDRLLGRGREALELSGASVDAADLAKALRCTLDLGERDWSTTLAVVRWVSEHPDERRFVRELPIRGIDTKWFERHDAAVAAWYEALRNAPLPPFRGVPRRVLVRFLDPSLAPWGMAELGVELERLAAMPVLPRTVLVCENQVSTLALPPMEGVMAVFGGGYAIGGVARIPWLEQVNVLYWGDLDTHGFAILDRFRELVPSVRSVLMDEPTLRAHRDLCVEEPTPTFETLERLTSSEADALTALHGPNAMLRLEQERIPWDYAVAALERALAESCD